MKILLTGANGFIGRYLVPRLRYNSVLYPTDRDSLDITDHDAVRMAIKSFEPDVVIHLAAATGRELATDPRWVIEHNVTATAVIARLCEEYGARLVYFSSSEAYGEVGNLRVNEKSPLGRATNLYGLSKQMSEAAVNLYTKALILRPVMPYGPGFPGTSMYPGPGKCALVNFIWKALHNEPLMVHRHTSRSWIWIGDMIEAIVLLIESGRLGTYNLGVEDDLGMIQLASKITHMVGKGKIRTIEPPDNLTRRKFISVDKLRKTGWEPKVTLDEGLGKTLEWLRGEMAKADQTSGSKG